MSAPRLSSLDLNKFENVHQVGGITSAMIEHPVGSGLYHRALIVDTGSGLRFTVSVARGGDIVEAFYNNHSLAYLSPVGFTGPSHAYSRGIDWLRNWPAGLLTTCGPRSAGPPGEIDGEHHGLHGAHSNLPASVEMVLNPDPHSGRHEMLVSLVVREARMFGPVVETRRQIQCSLGQPIIRVYDTVTNRGDTPCTHHWLYHFNFGYPLLDEGTRFIYRGRAAHWPVEPRLGDEQMTAMKTAPAPLAEHAGGGERGLILDPTPDDEGHARVGLINDRLGLGVELTYPADVLPRLLNWQHFGPRGSYVAGIEPAHTNRFPQDFDRRGDDAYVLQPGESRRYQVTLRVHADQASLSEFATHDGPILHA